MKPLTPIILGPFNHYLFCKIMRGAPILIALFISAFGCTPNQPANEFSLQLGMQQNVALDMVRATGWKVSDSATAETDSTLKKGGVLYEFLDVHFPGVKGLGRASLWFAAGKLTMINWQSWPSDSALRAHAAPRPSIADFQGLDAWATTLYGMPDDSVIEYMPLAQRDLRTPYRRIVVRWGPPSPSRARNGFKADVSYFVHGLLIYHAELLPDTA